MIENNNKDPRLFLMLVNFVRRIPLLHKATWQFRIMYNASKRMIFIRRQVVDVGPYLKTAILNKRPFSAGKMGSTEANSLSISLKREIALSKNRTPPEYGAYIFHTLHVNSGVFPKRTDIYDRFSQVYLDAVKQCDALVAWDVAGETDIFRAHCPKTILIQLYSLDPYFSNDPWSSALKGKRVLVISPFIDSIRTQYERREVLWDNPDILPAFELLTLRAPLSAGLVPPVDTDWFEALKRLKSEMSVLDYDVALVGAGAYSLPLIVHAKQQGKVGVHLGGTLQILFGVLGERWTRNERFAPFIKETWQRPNKGETPDNFKINEGGCYW